MATCRYCNQPAGFLCRQHGQCCDLHAEGIREMTQLAAQAAGFNETALRSTLGAIATRAQATETISPGQWPRDGPRSSSTPCRTASPPGKRKQGPVPSGTGWPTGTSLLPPKTRRPSPRPGHSRTELPLGTPDYREGHSRPFSGNLTPFPGTRNKAPIGQALR